MEGVILGYMEKEVRFAVEQHEIRECDPSVVAFLMLKMYVALTSEWNKQHQATLTKAEIRQHFRLFLEEGLSVK